MGYTDYNFYTQDYYGESIPESSFLRYADKAETFLNKFTYRRLVCKLPKDRHTSKQVKKCICEMADELYKVDVYIKATAVNESGKTQMIKSVSAGAEAYSYAGDTGPAAELAKNPQELERLLYRITERYLYGLCDDNGICLLYGGV